MCSRMKFLLVFNIFIIVFINNISESYGQGLPIGCEFDFPGIYKSNKTSDTIFYYLESCGPGTDFSIPPAPVYKCNIYTGVITPNIPLCVVRSSKKLECGELVVLPCAPSEGMKTCNGYLPFPPSDRCKEVCSCPEGTVFHEQHCISEDQCPCIHNNIAYQPGQFYEEKCQNCTCYNGDWKCSVLIKPECSGECHIIADPHFKTFDDKRYDFMGQCFYAALVTEDLVIAIENWAWGGTHLLPSESNKYLPTAVKAVTIKQNGININLDQKKVVKINGQYISKLPKTIDGIIIRDASSQFIFVDFPDGVQVKWDGIYSLYIRVPATYMNKTKGLCGIFNKNPNDDFTSRNGVVETNANIFGNSWKLEGNCSDIPPDGIPHPCDKGDGSQKANAKRYCDVLNSDVFKKCHSLVKPDTFYNDCMYDGCACPGKKPKSCICPLISAYSNECSRRGVTVDWTKAIPECEPDCPVGQTFQTCGNPCTRSCKDISDQPNCQPNCVEGCNCPKGQTLNENGDCIPINQCKCHRAGIDYPPGFKEIGGKELCTCQDARWSCKPATPDEQRDIINVRNHTIFCDKSLFVEFSSCLPENNKTCENMNTYEASYNKDCRYGCKCVDGYVWHNEKCIPIEECPCHLGGVSYKDGSVQQKDCNTCTCRKGKWNCTNRECTSECGMWSGSHYKTFDGKLYDFTGECKYTLVAGTLINNAFKVDVKTVACGDTSCLDTVTIEVGFGSTHKIIYLSKGKPIPTSQPAQGILIHKAGLHVVVELVNFSVAILWDGETVYVKTDASWKSKVSGLCGNYNGNSNDDYRTPSGQLTSLLNFADSWSLNKNCPKPSPLKECSNDLDLVEWGLEKCEILNSNVFSPCHKHVPVDSYYSNCIFDTCSCHNPRKCKYFCTTIAAYAQECNNKGVPIKWRNQDTCPIQCNNNLVYNPCVSSCPLNNKCLPQLESSKLCERNTCVEGCSSVPCTPIDNNSTSCKGCEFNFNGTYKINRTSDITFYHELLCPPGSDFSIPPALVYECNIYTGVISPNKIPNCIPHIQNNTINCGELIVLPCAPPEGLKTCYGYQPFPPSDHCKEVCSCPEGTVFHEQRCITEDQCPCIYNNRTYQPGQFYEEKCQTCTCLNGDWKCSVLIKPECSSECAIIGNRHFKTFDDRRYDFMGQCFYTALVTENLVIEIENLPTIVKSVTIKQYGITINLNQKKVVKINGQYVPKLPRTIAGITIRDGWSGFVFVDLPDGVQVKWDGVYSLYIRVPETYINKTKGLCGIFNRNTNDDFTLRNGAVETNAIIFGNSWKLDVNCPDIHHDVIPHPCDKGDGSQKASAKRYCDVINSDVFKKCHSVVKPETFYNECMYDGCACQGKKPTTCICPLIAAYSAECSRRGVTVDWTKAIPECEPDCPAGQTFQTCGNSCTRTCRDISDGPNCQPYCIEGCNCPIGQSLNEFGDCVPINQCKCHWAGKDFPPGYKQIIGKDLCTCQDALWSCIPFIPDNYTLCDKSLFLEFSTCLPENPKTCENLNTYEATYNKDCRYGCKCVDGYVWHNQKCIPIEECPCQLGGVSYKDGSVQQKDCNTCTCKDGKWSCTDRQCTSECAMWSGSHYKTFDAQFYDFTGASKYTLVKGKILNYAFEVVVKTVACGDTSYLDTVTIEVTSGFSEFASESTEVASRSTQTIIHLTKGKQIPSSQPAKGILIHKEGLYVVVELVNLSVSIYWNGETVYVKADSKWRSRVSGLCGNYNGNSTDDFRTATGQLTSLLNFANSWSLNKNYQESSALKECSNDLDLVEWGLEKCEILNSKVFIPCHKHVPVDSYYWNCVFDTCSCNDPRKTKYFCTTIAAYAQECNNKGVPIKWRNQDICPIQCNNNLVYNPCVSSCPLNNKCLPQLESSRLCERNTCVEGCSPVPCTPTNSTSLCL